MATNIATVLNNAYSLTDQYLEMGRFPYRYRVIGTKLRIASRKPPEQLPAIAGLIEVTQRP